MLKKQKPSYIFIISFLALLIGCSDDSVRATKNTLEIQIPINKTAVHANATYVESDGEMTLENLVISSLVFEEEVISNDTTYMNGTIEQYIPPLFENSGTKIGSVKISLTNKWVFMENISDNLSATPFFKQATDTTKKATIAFQHFPVFPRLIEEDQSTEIIREENNGDAWLLGTVYRKFQVGKEMTWDDVYGRQDGIFIKTLQHSFTNDTLLFSTMLDEFGLVVSQSSLKIVVIDNLNPENNDTTFVHKINRRIRNYAEPLLVPELNTFVDKIINTPLTFFIDN